MGNSRKIRIRSYLFNFKLFSRFFINTCIFLITYGIFVYSSGAILPAYFDLVSRVLYKHRAIFFAANLTTGSLAGFLVSRYVDFRIQEKGLVEGFSDGLLVVIAITSLSLIPLILIKSQKELVKKEKIEFSNN